MREPKCSRDLSLEYRDIYITAVHLIKLSTWLNCLFTCILHGNGKSVEQFTLIWTKHGDFSIHSAECWYMLKTPWFNGEKDSASFIVMKEAATSMFSQYFVRAAHLFHFVLGVLVFEDSPCTVGIYDWGMVKFCKILTN